MNCRIPWVLYHKGGRGDNDKNKNKLGHPFGAKPVLNRKRFVAFVLCVDDGIANALAHFLCADFLGACAINIGGSIAGI